MARYLYRIPAVNGELKYPFKKNKREKIYSWTIYPKYVEIVCSQRHEELEKEDVYFEEVSK